MIIILITIIIIIIHHQLFIIELECPWTMNLCFPYAQFLSLCIFPNHRVSPWGAHAMGALLPSVDFMEDSSIW